MKRGISFMAGLLLGGLVGGTLALLLAPSSGESIRSQMRTRVAQFQDEVKQAAAERRAELEQQLAALRAPLKGS